MSPKGALKIHYLDQLDPSKHTIETVTESIRRLQENGEITLKDIARFTGYQTSTLSQYFGGKYEAEPERIEQALIRFWKNWVSKNSVVKTQASEEVFALLQWAWKRKKIAVILGDNGRGKTMSTQAYCVAHPDECVYLALDATTRVLEFFDVLATSLGIEAQMTGPGSLRKAAIIRALQRKPRMIVIDEADEIKPSILSALRTIWADNEGRCAIVLVGTHELERMLRSPKNHLRYMDTRISLRLRIREMTEEDGGKLVNCYPHSLERAEIREIIDWANKSSRTQGGMRSLANLMGNAYDIMQQDDKEEIDTDCIDRAKALM